ncbi:MAG: leucine-rich repeat domain-containing protein [Bacteroidales bacterium]
MNTNLLACEHRVNLDGKPVFRSLEVALKNPAEVERLHLKKKKLKAIPPEVFLFTNLLELDLSGNRIELIPEEIARLKNLKVLNISNNRIHTVSDSIRSLSRLEIMDLSRNYINTFPPQIQHLKSLTCLIIWKNEVGRLPDEIAALKDNIKYLDIRHNPYPPENIQILEGLLPDTTILKTRHCACNDG